LLDAMIAFGAIDLGATTLGSAPAFPKAPQPPPETRPQDLSPQEQALTSEIRKFAVQLDDLDFFQVLGLDRKADDAAVNRAYLALQRKFDPGRLSPAMPRQIQRMTAAILERLQTAYDTLHDQVGRRRYLRQLPGEKPGEPPPSVDDLAAGEKSTPKENRGLLQKALLEMERRHYAVAADALRKALALDPQNSGLQIKLAQAMFGALAEPPFTWAEVEEAARQALASNKNHPEALALLGRIKVRQNDDESALRFLKKAFEQDPRNDTVRREIRYAEQRLKEADKRTSLFGKKR
jgi:tetratricopeptide (TPR) repeat protein